MFRAIKLAVAVSLLCAGSAFAQQKAVVVTTCGTPPGTYTAGETRPLLQNTNGEICATGVSGTSGEIFPENYGALCDGSTDDTTALVAWAAAANPNKEMLPGKTCITNGRITFTASHLVLDGHGSTIKAKSGMTVDSSHDMLRFSLCDSPRIQNLNVDGNRATRSPAEVSAHNIFIIGCTKVFMENVRSFDCVTDCIYLVAGTNTDASTYVQNYYIANVHTDNAYRNGMSVINSRRGTIVGGSYNNTVGTNPEAGIDFESNGGTDADPGNSGVTLIGVEFKGNAGYGLQLDDNDASTGFTVIDPLCDANVKGAIVVSANDVSILRGRFINNAATVVQAVIYFQGNATITKGKVSGVDIVNSGAVPSSLYAHGVTSGVVFEDFSISGTAGVNGIIPAGRNISIIRGKIGATTQIAINGTGADTLVDGTEITGSVGRSVLLTGARPTIMHVHAKDQTGSTVAYIQTTGTDPTVMFNWAEATASTPGDTSFNLAAGNPPRAFYGNIITNLGAVVGQAQTLLGTFDSAALKTALSDEIDAGGSGKAIFSAGGLNITSGKTFATTNTLTLAGTDSTTMTFPSTSATIARTDVAQTFTGHNIFEGVTPTGATGTGNLTFSTSPTLTTPVLGVATATSINKTAITAPATSSTLAVADGKTLTASNSLTLAGTDSTVMTFPSTSATIARTDVAQTFTGHNVFEGVTPTGATGTGNIAFSASPTFTGTLSAASITASSAITVGAGSALLWNGRSRISSSASGKINFADNAGTGATTLTIGAETTSFPQLAASGAAILFRLGDGTGNVPITASSSRIIPVAVGSLPTCNAGADGTYLGVTDALTPVALATVAAGGSSHVPVYCNGTNWIVP